MIIGICGYKQSGKDTTCNILFECFSTKEFRNIHRIGLFDAGKVSLAVALGTTVSQLNKAKVEHPPIRRLLQDWGDYQKELHGENYYIKCLEDKIKQTIEEGIPNDTHLFIVPDVRFPAEAAWIKSKGGIVLKVDRGAANLDEHPSEQNINNIIHDYFVNNNGTLAALRRDVVWIASYIKEKIQKQQVTI